MSAKGFMASQSISDLRSANLARETYTLCEALVYGAPEAFINKDKTHSEIGLATTRVDVFSYHGVVLLMLSFLKFPPCCSA